MDSDGFTLTWSTNDATAKEIGYIAIGGTSITAEVGSFLTPTSTGSHSVSTGIANADFLMLMSGAVSSQDSIANTLRYSIGVATGPSNEGNCAFNSSNGVTTTVTDRYQRTSAVFSQISSALQQEATFTNFTASGFDLNFGIGTIARHVFYLTIKGGQWEVGNGTTPTSTGTKAFTTSFQPKGMGHFSFNLTSSASINANNFFDFGATDGTNEFAMAVEDRDARTSVSDANRIFMNTKAYANISNSSSTLEEADHDSFNATDFTLDFTKVNATAREFIWFVVGDT
jgi:hypothetical protein